MPSLCVAGAVPAFPYVLLFAGDKIRPVDDMSISGVNAATAATEALTCDTLDMLTEASRQMHECCEALISHCAPDSTPGIMFA